MVTNDLIMKAEKGDPQAQYDLAFEYNREKDFKASVNWLVKSAKNGNKHAQWRMGQMHDCNDYEEWGIPHDIEEAIKWYKKAAIQGSKAAYCSLARYFFSKATEEKDFLYAFELFKKSGISDEHGKGSAIARESIMSFYVSGVVLNNKQIMSPNIEEAIRWHELTFDDEVVPTTEYKFICGCCYSTQCEIDRDMEMVKKAIFWYLKVIDELEGDKLKFVIEELWILRQRLIRHYAGNNPEEGIKWHEKTFDYKLVPTADYMYSCGNCYMQWLRDRNNLDPGPDEDSVIMKDVKIAHSTGFWIQKAMKSGKLTADRIEALEDVWNILQHTIMDYYIYRETIEEAIKWYELTFDNDFTPTVDSIYYCGVSYLKQFEDGKGIEFAHKARACMQKAINSGELDRKRLEIAKKQCEILSNI